MKNINEQTIEYATKVFNKKGRRDLSFISKNKDNLFHNLYFLKTDLESTTTEEWHLKEMYKYAIKKSDVWTTPYFINLVSNDGEVSKKITAETNINGINEVLKNLDDDTTLCAWENNEAFLWHLKETPHFFKDDTLLKQVTDVLYLRIDQTEHLFLLGNSYTEDNQKVYEIIKVFRNKGE